MIKVPTVWDARYSCEAAPLLSTSKQARVVEQAQKEGLLAIQPMLQPSVIEIFQDIKFCHETRYVDAVMTGEPKSLAESQGFDWSPAFAESVARIWHGHKVALALTRSNPLLLHPVSGAHHAHRHRGGGFCTFNYLVGAATAFLHRGERCLIIDLDAHYGDGTAAMIVNDDRFALFDISGGTHTGASTWDGAEFAFEVQHARHYMQILRTQLPLFLDKVKPTLVQYLAGADPYMHDKVGSITGMGMKTLQARDRFVLDEVTRRGIPTVVTLAGGYVPGATEQIHVNTIREMSAALEG